MLTGCSRDKSVHVAQACGAESVVGSQMVSEKSARAQAPAYRTRPGICRPGGAELRARHCRCPRPRGGSAAHSILSLRKSAAAADLKAWRAARDGSCGAWWVGTGGGHGDGDEDGHESGGGWCFGWWRGEEGRVTRIRRISLSRWAESEPRGRCNAAVSQTRRRGRSFQGWGRRRERGRGRGKASRMLLATTSVRAIYFKRRGFKVRWMTWRAISARP